MRCLFFLLIASSCAAVHGQNAFSDAFVFGDSLSDIGNIDSVTLGLRPGDDYFDGRFSNGRVYSELLYEKLGLGEMRPSTDGGSNFAFGGGRTSGTSFFEGGLFIRDLDDQIDSFLEDRTIDPDALHVILAGANDFVLGEQTNPSTPASRVENEIDRLLGAGVTNLLSINLPLLGQTPRFADDSAAMNSRSREFNQLLDQALDDAVARYPRATIFRVDLAGLFARLIALPAQHAFLNVTEEGNRAADATGYLFWDDIHPTTQGHELLARAAVSQVQQAGTASDFNFDNQVTAADADIFGYTLAMEAPSLLFDLTGDATVDVADFQVLLDDAQTRNGDANFDRVVDFADFLIHARNFDEADGVVWSQGDFDFSGRVDFADFLVLARNFGDSVDPLESEDAPLTVPEPLPARWALALAGALLPWRSRRAVRRTRGEIATCQAAAVPF